VLASGITLLQVSANPYVSLLGDPATASSRLTMTQAFNSLGTTLAPYFGAFFILSTSVKTPVEISLLNVDELTAYQTLEASAVQFPYLLLASVLFGVSLIFALVKLPQVKVKNTGNSLNLSQNNNQLHPDSAWHYPHLLLGAVAIFVYVGAEVSIGSFLVSFLTDSAITNFKASEAAKYVSFYWGGAMVGRFAGAAVMKKNQPHKVLVFNAASAAILVVITICSSGTIAMIAILAVGLFNSIMFPTIFSLAVARLNEHTGQGSGILCSAIVGGAVFPIIQGLCADRTGVQLSFFIPVLCYLYIAGYGLIYPAFQPIKDFCTASLP
jgi:FHS family L-fucose permease-like MFS transporter